MAMALADLGLSVNFMRQGSWLNLAGPCSQTHCASKFFHATQLAQLVNHAMRSSGIELARIRLSQAAYITRELNAGSLHTQTNSEVRNLLLPRITDGIQHT